MKRFLAVFTVFCLGLTMTATAFAVESEVTAETEATTVDYLNYEFPDGAEVLYQSEEGVIYYTEDVSYSARTSYPLEVEFSSGDTTLRRMEISNPHLLGGTCEGSFRLVCSNANASGQMLLYNDRGTQLLATRILSPSDGEYRFSFNSVGTKLILSCIPYRTPAKTTYICNLW